MYTGERVASSARRSHPESLLAYEVINLVVESYHCKSGSNCTIVDFCLPFHWVHEPEEQPIDDMVLVQIGSANRLKYSAQQSGDR